MVLHDPRQEELQAKAKLWMWEGRALSSPSTLLCLRDKLLMKWSGENGHWETWMHRLWSQGHQRTPTWQVQSSKLTLVPFSAVKALKVPALSALHSSQLDTGRTVTWLSHLGSATARLSSEDRIFFTSSSSISLNPLINTYSHNLQAFVFYAL